MKTSLITMMMLASVLYSCNSKDKTTVTKNTETNVTSNAVNLVERGKYLVNAVGCADCHSPKIMGPKGPMDDPDRTLSGARSDLKLPEYDSSILKNYALFDFSLTAAIGPWGTSYSANLTPDDTGIGTWSEQQFITAMRKGKFKGLEGSRDLLPPMPWHYYRNFNNDDLRAIFAYLKTIKPVENVVPSAKPPVGMAQ